MAFKGGHPVAGIDPTGKLTNLNTDVNGTLLIIMQSGSVISSPDRSTTSSAPAIITVGVSSVLLLAANTSAKRRDLQNVGTTKLYVLRAASGASSSNYHFILPAGGSAGDGSSPVYEDTLWQGAYCAASSAIGGQCSVGELT